MLARRDDHIYKDLLTEFPYQADETGACEMLDKSTNQCKVYETRPDVCRVDSVYERLFAHHMTRDNYHRASEAACKILQEDAETA